MRILLLSAYDAASHRRWREQLVSQLPHHDWVQLTLPARYFGWRIRGNSLSWAFEQRTVLEKEYDIVLATSMVDLSSLRGFIPSLGNAKTIVYFHENQFAYPVASGQSAPLEPKIVNLYTALCADRVVFNSDYNARSFISGVSALMKKLPDHVPMAAVDQLRERTQVLPVPIHEREQRGSVKAEVFTMVWNHRWEYDKGVDRLLSFCRLLLPTSIPFHMHIVGETFRNIPEVMKTIENLFERSPHAELLSFGFISDLDQYRNVLESAHLVLSTAVHDFQGLSVMDGVNFGCTPVVPDRLAYQDIFLEDYRYPSVLNDIEAEAMGMVKHVERRYQQWCKTAKALPCPSLSAFSWATLAERYDELLSVDLD